VYFRCTFSTASMSLLRYYLFIHSFAPSFVLPSVFCLQRFDMVGRAGRASGLLKLSDVVLVWLSVWSDVQIVCIRSSWCHCIPKLPSSLASFKSRMVLPFGYWLTQVVLEKSPLSGCSSSSSYLFIYFSHSCRDNYLSLELGQSCRVGAADDQSWN